MKRGAICLLLLFTWSLLVQVITLGVFMVQQPRIARDLCVQRNVAEESRTCHGECCLRKQLGAAKGEDADERTPPERMEWRGQTWICQLFLSWTVPVTQG